MSSAKGPAIGFKASAACAELSISVLPWACSVAAVVTIIESAIRFEKAMPIIVSVMENATMPALEMRVPLKVDARSAMNWDEAH